MKDISRRTVLAGSITVSLAGLPPERNREDLGILQPDGPDELLLKRATVWSRDAASIEAMQHRWQDLESIVFDRARDRKMSCSEACKGDWPEAREMRLLGRKIEAGYRRLDRSAGAISRMTAITPVGALAKIDVGLQWQGPYDWWKPHAWELMDDGIQEIRAMIALA